MIVKIIYCIKLKVDFVEQDSPDLWMTKQDYLEEGFRCLRKCG